MRSTLRFLCYSSLTSLSMSESFASETGFLREFISFTAEVANSQQTLSAQLEPVGIKPSDHPICPPTFVVTNSKLEFC